jgi:hypothetical protein
MGILLSRSVSQVLTYGVHTAMESDAGEILAANPLVTSQRPLIGQWIVHFCWSESAVIWVPTNDIDFTCNSTSDIGTCFRELAVPFHLQCHSRAVVLKCGNWSFLCLYFKMSKFSFENVWNTQKCLDEKVMMQLESILKCNCFFSMVYTKRSPKSYGGRKCGHRKYICENHCSRDICR